MKTLCGQEFKAEGGEVCWCPKVPGHKGIHGEKMVLEVGDEVWDTLLPHPFKADENDDLICAICKQPKIAYVHAENAKSLDEEAAKKLARVVGKTAMIIGHKDDIGASGDNLFSAQMGDVTAAGDSEMVGGTGGSAMDADNQADMPEHEFTASIGFDEICALCGMVEPSAAHDTENGKSVKSLRHKAESETDVDTDDDVGLLAQAIDAAIDEALEAAADGEMNQAFALIVAADAVVDRLMELLGVEDPDEADEDVPGTGGKSADLVTLTPQEIVDITTLLADLALEA